MSHSTAKEPVCSEAAGSVELAIEGRVKDLDGADVRRVLPSARRRMVGPFVFFDHFGPSRFPPGKGLAVRPHPHIGLATVSYLFDGEIMHRDSLGCVQPIRPGAVNLMTAGRGIVHSERSGEDGRASTLHGLQLWMALPDSHEDCEPAFEHVDADSLPEFRSGEVHGRVMLGSAYGRRSPAALPTPAVFAELRMPAGSDMSLPDDYPQLAVYVVDGRIAIDGHEFGVGVMAVACERRVPLVRAVEDSRIAIIGGEPVGERHVWWNFVASSRERIEQAAEAWKAGRFPKVPGDDEFIPLPER